MDDLTVLLFSAAIFVSVVAITFMLMMIVVSKTQVRQRVTSAAELGSVGAVRPVKSPFSDMAAVNQRVFSVTPGRLSQLRLDLQRAGFFSDEAPRTFLLLRTLSIAVLPTLGYIASVIALPGVSTVQQFAITATLLMIGFLLPKAVLDRRKAMLLEDYRRKFPDLLDMLVVCVDAGLSFEGALQRLAFDFGKRSPEIGINLQILSSELRAGRALTEALDGLAERMGLDEVRSFSLLLKQSLELGSDIGGALRIYSEEMRDKRVARAEEKANRLPVVMVIPLGLFIFPVIMVIILFPAANKMIETLKTLSGG